MRCLGGQETEKELGVWIQASQFPSIAVPGSRQAWAPSHSGRGLCLSCSALIHRMKTTVASVGQPVCACPRAWP